MRIKLDENWKTKNNGYALLDEEVERYISVLPSANQQRLQDKPFYAFIHFGMNTSTGREWGNATEACDDFTITKIKPAQWVKTIKSAGLTGIILTCKHHDGFCLWNTGTTDFNIMNTEYGKDLVKELSDECKKQGVEFGVYLSPWDMHEECYATEQYNDFFCRQLSELLTNYGELFEVWFDGAKGAEAKAFDYDWDRYYKLIRSVQPNANISICGPDIRWVGNEAGKSRESEFCVVPEMLARAESVAKNSQHSEGDASSLQKVDSKDEDLGSRKIISKNANLIWYPAEVDVSIRKGWFYPGGGKTKSVKKLMNIYYSSVGNNCTLLLNIPPNDKGVISRKDARALKKFGDKVRAITESPVLVQRLGEMTEGYYEFKFDSQKKLKHCIIKEDITHSQRVEKFDLYLMKPNGRYKRVHAGTVIGMQKIIKVKGNFIGALFIVRQSRSTPFIKEIAFYE